MCEPQDGKLPLKMCGPRNGRLILQNVRTAKCAIRTKREETAESEERYVS